MAKDGEPHNSDHVMSASNRRHPTSAELDYMLFTELPLLIVSDQYEKGRIAMEAFFASGRNRPEHGDESF